MLCARALPGQLAPINPLRDPKEGEAPSAAKALVTATGEFSVPDAAGRSVLSVTAKIAKGWHIYSVTQKKGGPIATKIKLDEKDFRVIGEFKPTRPPEVHEYPQAWKDLKVEEHHSSVTWKGTIELAQGVEPSKLEIIGAVYAQACSDQCIAPKSYKFTARIAAKDDKGARAAIHEPAPADIAVAGGLRETQVSEPGQNVAQVSASSEPSRQSNLWPPKRPTDRAVRLATDQQPIGPKAFENTPELGFKALPFVGVGSNGGPRAGEYKHPDLEATIRGRIEPAVVAPGEKADLVLSITPSAGWFFYAYAEEAVKGRSRPTLIRLTETGGLTAGMPAANAAPKSKPYALLGGATVLYYDKPVEWTIPLEVPRDASPGVRTIAGLVGLQTCDENTCLAPHGVQFSGTLTVGDATVRETTELAFSKTSYSVVAGAISNPLPPSEIGSARSVPPAPAAVEPTGQERYVLPPFEPRNLSSASGLGAIILASLLGGLLLNLMPCVLPVIGLKILAFVEQGGRQRSHVLALNLWYSAGILSVFLVLASLAVFLNVGWGEQFQSTGFNVVMAALVFVMALSFLGVWEIPIPGFAGSSTATKLAHREGYFGAFVKGILTTVLATPCSGPLLGTVFGFTLKQPPHVTYIVFGAIGLGMALPYLLIGAFPNLIRFLPKPGAWMDTFKQVMGFVLLGTVVILMTFMDRDYVVPTMALLVVLWAACWWINRTPLTADLERRLLAWGQAALFAGVVGYFSFNLLMPGTSVLKWEPFSIAAWEKHTADGKTVLVDFTADWCLNCKLNMAVAIDTEEVRRLAEANGVVPLLADYSDMSEEIKQMLEALGSRSIPFLAVFPAGERSRPIVLRDLVTKGQVVDALQQAGPSKTLQTTAVVMRGAE
jgi:thiol:disulfide interchange protein